MRNDRRHARAFVLQIDSETDSASEWLAGSIEHVASGRAIPFTSPEELQAFIVRMLSLPEETADA